MAGAAWSGQSQPGYLESTRCVRRRYPGSNGNSSRRSHGCKTERLTDLVITGSVRANLKKPRVLESFFTRLMLAGGLFKPSEEYVTCGEDQEGYRGGRRDDNRPRRSGTVRYSSVN